VEDLSSLPGLQTEGRSTSVMGRHRMGAIRRLNLQGYQKDREAYTRHRRYGHWEFDIKTVNVSLPHGNVEGVPKQSGGWFHWLGVKSGRIGS
jgi:hypothetical protein